MDHVHVYVGEITVDQFKRRAKQQATSLSYPSLVSMLCVRASCPLFWPLDKIVWADSVINLATKTDKDAPAMKRAKSTENRTPPPPSVPSNTSAGQFHEATSPTTTPPDLLAQVHENYLVMIAKAIQFMIQNTIKKAMQPARDKFIDLYTTIEVLQNEEVTLRKEAVALTGPLSISNPIPLEPVAVPSQLEAPKSPPDD
ncbi:hypothetical protein HAX54_027555 [Datura stramonium]|uniref:Uncharacterized protein n=1 Tax=Datura stramonium TaxID=4076 RepID=A0ABS8V2T7_DATST|nr:hypothetical protein [Datura stramonium]